MKIWSIILGLCAFLVTTMPAEAGSGCGACPVGGGKKASSTQTQGDTAGSGQQQEASEGSKDQN